MLNYEEKYIEVETLKGKTLEDVVVNDNQIIFKSSDGTEYLMEHDQDCCEHVTIEDFCGDKNDLIGTPIVDAYVSSNEDEAKPANWVPDYEPESYTWTFYRIATVKGAVTIRWFGTSNGYYSEGVSFTRIK